MGDDNSTIETQVLVTRALEALFPRLQRETRSKCGGGKVNAVCVSSNENENAFVANIAALSISAAI